MAGVFALLDQAGQSFVYRDLNLTAFFFRKSSGWWPESPNLLVLRIFRALGVTEARHDD